MHWIHLAHLSGLIGLAWARPQDPTATGDKDPDKDIFFKFGYQSDPIDIPDGALLSDWQKDFQYESTTLKISPKDFCPIDTVPCTYIPGHGGTCTEDELWDAIQKDEDPVRSKQVEAMAKQAETDMLQYFTSGNTICFYNDDPAPKVHTPLPQLTQTHDDVYNRKLTSVGSLPDALKILGDSATASPSSNTTVNPRALGTALSKRREGNVLTEISLVGKYIGAAMLAGALVFDAAVQGEQGAQASRILKAIGACFILWAQFFQPILDYWLRPRGTVGRAETELFVHTFALMSEIAIQAKKLAATAKGCIWAATNSGANIQMINQAAQQGVGVQARPDARENC